MKTSEIALGCVSFGDPNWRDIGWILDEKESAEVIEHAIDRGINYFDTANRYSFGESERVLGNALSGYDREKFVIATKAFTQMNADNPNSGGLSRKSIEQEVEHSLDRLGIDTIDIYQIHRWDYETPIDVTLATLTDLVRRGTVRSVGASSMWTHQFFEAIRASERNGYDSFAVMQNLYNLVYREEEREMLPFCRNEKVAVTPWSPLASGFLARPMDELEATSRGETLAEYEGGRIQRFLDAGGAEINERVAELAAEKGVSMAQISLAWLLGKEWVDVPIVGATKPEHVDDAVEATEIDLGASEMEFLEEPYEPVPTINRREHPDPR
jgi:aryl-alcohol dehydrogenase-like predicted oxidoreductase